MIADAFCYCEAPDNLTAKTFPGNAVKESFTAGCTVENGIAGNDVFLALAAEIRRTSDDNAAAGQTFTDIVIAFSDKIQGNAF